MGNHPLRWRHGGTEARRGAWVVTIADAGMKPACTRHPPPPAACADILHNPRGRLVLHGGGVYGATLAATTIVEHIERAFALGNTRLRRCLLHHGLFLKLLRSMKSERRHELQTNSLATAIQGAPQFLRVHGSKVFLGLIIVLLAAIFLYQRTRRNQEQLDAGWSNIAVARTSLARLQVMPRYIESPIQLAAARKQTIEGASAALAPMLGSDNRQIAAEAYLVRGDLNFAIANLPAIAAAATQPALQIEGDPADHLAKAQEAYDKVLRVYPEEHRIVTNARFGLAAVAENKRDFDGAAKIYQEITNDEKTLPAFKTLAELRLASLDNIRKPIYLAPAVIPATAPTTAPATAPQK